MESNTPSGMEDSIRSSIVVASTTSIVEYPVEEEVINDESTDSEVEKKLETKMRLQSIYNRTVSEPSVLLYPSMDPSKFKHCVVCERPIIDLVVWAMNKPHHCRCLVCFVCKQPVGFQKFKVIEGKMFMCYKDYYESYQKCRICQKPFSGRTKRSYSQLYHKDCFKYKHNLPILCFKCVNCFEPLVAEGALGLFDETYCISCAESIVTKKNLLQSYYETIDRKYDLIREPGVELGDGADENIESTSSSSSYEPIVEPTLSFVVEN